MDKQNIQELKTDRHEKLTGRMVNFTDAFGGDVFGFVTDIQVRTGKNGEPEVSIAVNGRWRTVCYSFLTTTLKVF
ncbi:hypothetical protein [uncultured Chitinophaga sp.]|uniref:hypothetical protein n=1 Tax=uncultured Chitinophaga sp. TaxID=339340 RepID=UPI002633DD65|nr:hypothetical protein [uncultured Chitinophaga sp.]